MNAVTSITPFITAVKVIKITSGCSGYNLGYRDYKLGYKGLCLFINWFITRVTKTKRQVC